MVDLNDRVTQNGSSGSHANGHGAIAGTGHISNEYFFRGEDDP